MADTDLRRGLREARQNLKNGKVREALARLFHLTEKYPEDTEVKGQIAVALLERGREYAERGRMEKAQEDFERSIGYSETPEGHLCLGRIHQIRGEYEDAFVEYTKALDLDDQLPAIHENLGFYFLDIQDFEQAAKAFANALSNGATGRDSHLGLWKANMLLERFDRAEEAISDAVAKFPNDDAVLTAAGLCASARQEPERAEEFWTRAARGNPKSVDAHFHLAGLAASQGRRDDALKLIRKCALIDRERTRTLLKEDAGTGRPRFAGYDGDEDFLDALG